MTTPTYKGRQRAAIVRIKAGKEALLEAIKGLSAEDALKGSEWSVADVMRHLGGRAGYQGYIQRMLQENNPELPPRPTPDEQWQRIVDQMVEIADEVIALAEGLSEEQLARTAVRQGQTFTVMDYLERTAGHYEEHAKQVKEEIRPRLGL